MDITSAGKYSNLFNRCIAYHKKFTDLNDLLMFNDTWDKDSILEYKNVIDKYTQVLESLTLKINDKSQWTDKDAQKEARKLFNDIKDDDEMIMKHEAQRLLNYKIFMQNRDDIILNLIFTYNRNNLKDLILYFITTCSLIPLYIFKKNLYINKENYKDYIYIQYLKKWYNDPDNKEEIHKNIDSEEKTYTNIEIDHAFDLYYNARTEAFDIFNKLSLDPQLFVDTSGMMRRFKYYCQNRSELHVIRKLHLEMSKERAEFDLKMEDTKQQENIIDMYLDKLDESMEVYEASFYSLFNDMRDKTKVKKVLMVPRDAHQCLLRSDGKSVYADTTFYQGEIIEICPTKEISLVDLHSRSIRDIMFEIEPNLRYVIPFGYCLFYELADEENEANCDYMWDPNTSSIIIKALTTVPKGSRLFLNVIK